MNASRKRVQEAVSLLIRNPDRPSQVLLVLRPETDPDLPNLWGLPAGRRRPGEGWRAAAERAGKEKLGVRLRVGSLAKKGSLARNAYTLRMRLYEALVAQGTPAVPQPSGPGTQYQAWKWGGAEEVVETARRGSLCCRLFLEASGLGY